MFRYKTHQLWWYIWSKGKRQDLAPALTAPVRVMNGLDIPSCKEFIMKKILPTKLAKEPLIDAVFEVRFSSSFPASDILPGFFFVKLEGDKVMEDLPAAQLPKAIRDADPNLQFVPIKRLDWDQFFVSIGDRSVAISCKLPYPGWKNFKFAIIKLMAVLGEIDIIQSIERYSMKYVDLIPSSDLQQQISYINFDVAIANHKLQNEAFQLRVEMPRDGFTNAVQVVSSAKLTLPNGEIKEGVVVDVDTIANLQRVPLPALLDGFEGKLDSIHQTNKTIFFDCLKPETIEALEPSYE